jgi:pimeloyl-ACP methyl ester carboxylesterase
LAKSEINPPYVLVGHSLGGLIVRVFADQYASDVAGMVLVDSSHEDQAILIVDRATKKERVVHWRELASGKTIPPVQTSMPALTSPNTGQTSRLPGNGSKLESPYDKLPSQVQELRRWATSRSSYQQARGSETFDFLADELARIYAARTGRKSPLEDKPLIVLTRGVAGEDETSNRQLLEDHDRLQLDLLSLSTNSKQIIAKASGHWIQLDQPQLVTEAIKEVVYAVRHRSRLSK